MDYGTEPQKLGVDHPPATPPEAWQSPKHHPVQNRPPFKGNSEVSTCRKRVRTSKLHRAEQRTTRKGIAETCKLRR